MLEPTSMGWPGRLVLAISSGVLCYAALHLMQHPVYGLNGSIVIALSLTIFMFFIGAWLARILEFVADFINDFDLWPGARH